MKLVDTKTTKGKVWDFSKNDEVEVEGVYINAKGKEGKYGDFGNINLISTPGNIYYVATNGNDARPGEHPQDPVRTIAKGLTLAGVGDTVYIYPGTYQEAFPLNVPTKVVAVIITDE